MNPSQAWAMLSARGAQLICLGGRPELTAADVARLLKDLERAPFLMGLAIEAGDLGGVPELEQLLLEEIRALRHDRGWPMSRREQQEHLPRLAGLSVFEALNPRPERCSTCNSRGYIRTRTNALPCHACGQTGGRPLSAHRRSYLAGIAWSTWRESWAAKYEQIHALACGWHGRAISHMAQALRQGGDRQHLHRPPKWHSLRPHRRGTIPVA